MPEPATTAAAPNAASVRWQGGCLVAPSLLSFDLCNLERDVRTAESAGIRVLHIDVLDGHFSPSMPLGIGTIAQLRQRTSLALDVHVMTARHDYFVDALLDIGVQQLSFHQEVEPHADRLIRRIHSAGARAGVALKPATPLSTLDYLLESCDTVLLMLSNPGYSGHGDERPVTYARRKIHDLVERITRLDARTTVQIDGRVSADTIREFSQAGVDIFVAGSALISTADFEGSMRRLAEIHRTNPST